MPSADEVHVFSPDVDLAELSPMERRFVEGKSRSPREAQEGLRKLAERVREAPHKYPQGLAWIGVPPRR